ncbi:MAG: hypothetical protein WBX25_00695 [Rhodomicrobium sp.]
MKYWHDRAEEVLVRLETTKDEGARGILFRIYVDYLRLGRLAEENANIAENATPQEFKCCSPPS